MDHIQIIFALILAGFLIALTVIDLKTFRLPDALTYPLIALGLLQYWVLNQSIWVAIIGMALGYLVFVGLELAYKRLRGRDGLGRGDAKLLAAGGAWCGAYALPFIVLIASLSALVLIFLPLFKSKLNQGRLPFGPFLAVGIFSVWVAFQLSGIAAL